MTPKLTSSLSNGRRTPVARTTIDADVTDNVSDKRVAMTTTATSAMISSAHGRPKTPVNTVSPRTPRDAVTKTTLPVQSRSKTPDIESIRNVASFASADRTPTTPRGRSATRGVSLADTTMSVPTTRGRTALRSSSVGRHEMTLTSSAEWPGVGGERNHQRRGDSPSTSSTLRRSGTSSDIRRDVTQAAADESRSNPRVLMISRNTDGRHVVGDHVTQAEGHRVAARQQSQPNLNRNYGQLSLQRQQQPQSSAPSTPRNQTASVTARLSMTADKLLPSKLRVQQPQTKQLHSLDGDAGRDAKRVDDGEGDGDDVTKRASLNWSVNGALAAGAAPSRGPLRRTASVGEPFVDDSGNKATTIDQLPRVTGPEMQSSTCRISVIKRSSSVETASTNVSTTFDGGSCSIINVVDTTRLDDVDVTVDRSAPGSAMTTKTVELDGDGTSIIKRSAETVLATVTASESSTGSSGTLPASNVITGDTDRFTVGSTGELTAARLTSGNENNSDNQQATQTEVHSPTSTSFQTLLNSLPDLPPPEDDEEINSKMEMLFEEYRKVELGLMDLVWKANNEVDLSAGQHHNSAARKMPRGGSTVGASKVQRQAAPRGREPIYSGRTTTTASVRPMLTGEKATQGSLTSGVRRSLSRPASALEHTETVTPTAQRSSSPRGSARRSSSLYRGNSDASVSQSCNTRSTSTPKPTRHSASATSTNGAERVGSRSARGDVSGAAADRRRARSCVRSDERGDLRRTMSVSFDVGRDADDIDSDGDQTAAAGTLAGHGAIVVPSSEVEGQRSPLTTTATSNIPTTSTTMTFGRCRRRSYSRVTSDERTPTKIPMPVDAKRMTSHESFDERLKRVDSGVDINNMI